MGLAAAGWLHPIFAALIMLLSSLFVTSRAVASWTEGTSETSHVPRLPICCNAGKALSPMVGLEALATSNAASAQQVASLSTQTMQTDF